MTEGFCKAVAQAIVDDWSGEVLLIEGEEWSASPLDDNNPNHDDVLLLESGEGTQHTVRVSVEMIGA
jgi:hypothetical protein